MTDSPEVGLEREVERLKVEVGKLRKIWWRDHKCKAPFLYGDDGEMMCNCCFADFKRENVLRIEDHIWRSLNE